MIGAVAHPSRMVHHDMTGPGNKMNSPGHLAKASVASALEAGADLPKNAQGLAASAIAKGADPAAIFSALIAPDTPADVGADDFAPVAAPMVEKSIPVQDAPPEAIPEGSSDVALSGGSEAPFVPTTSAEAIALGLLSTADTPDRF
ncbi:MAG: hypothetical protein HKN18_03750 [Silicimonas sp.]|nr:hypothetical protein [Silicimonas sp.]